MTTKRQPYPTRVPFEFQGKERQVVLDQLRAVDKSRLVQKLGRIEKSVQREVLVTIAEMFAE
jgi:mRNA interferase MazF